MFTLENTGITFSSNIKYLDVKLQILQTDGHQVVAGCVLAGVEDVIPGTSLTHQVGAGAGQQLG